MKKLNDSYEWIDSHEDTKELLKQKGIKARFNSGKTPFFYSKDIKIAGMSPTQFNIHYEGWPPRDCVDDSEQIEGLHCPDCDAQAYKTDHPNIATCGAYAGWFFFYRKIENQQQFETRHVIKNGKIVAINVAKREIK